MKKKCKTWKRKSPLPPVEELVKQISSGCQLSQLCRKYKEQSAKITSVLEESGYTFKSLRESVMRSDALSALERIKAGENIKDVVAGSPWPTSKFSAIIRETAGIGIKFLKPKPALVSDSIPIGDIQRTVDALAKGTPLRHIAKDLGYQLQHLYKALQRHTGKKVNDLKGWTPRQKEVVRLAQEGKSLGEIARECNVSRQCISQILQEVGMVLPRKEKRENSKSLVKSLILEGLNREQIIDKTGLCSTTISKIAKKEGIEIARKPYAKNRHQEHPAKEKVIQDAKNGDHYPVIAQRYGVALMTVHVWAKSAGIQSKPRGSFFRKPLTNLDEIFALAKSGVSARQIALQFGISQVAVRREVRKMLGNGYFRKPPAADRKQRKQRKKG